jgi:hypothetical protein
LNGLGNRQNKKHGLLNSKFLNPIEAHPRPEDKTWLAVMAAKCGEARMIADILHEYDLKPPPTRFRLTEATDIRAEGRPRTRGHFGKKVEEKKRQQVEKERVQEIEDKKGQITKHSNIIDALNTAIESEYPRMTAILLEEV